MITVDWFVNEAGFEDIHYACEMKQALKTYIMPAEKRTKTMKF